MSSTDRPDLVFLGATVETMTDDADPADAVAVRDGRIVVRREFGGCAAPDRAGNAGDRARRRDAPPRIPGCACPPHRRRHALPELRPPRPGRCGRVPRSDRGPRHRPPRPRVDHRERLVAAGVPSRRAAPLAARCDRLQPSGPAGERRRTRGLGQLEGPRHRRDHSRDARSARWPDRPRPRWRTDGHAARLRDRPRLCAMRRRRPTTICSRGCARPSAISTRWGSPAGRTPMSSPMRWPPTATRPRPAGSRRASSRPSGGRARPDSS